MFKPLTGTEYYSIVIYEALWNKWIKLCLFLDSAVILLQTQFLTFSLLFDDMFREKMPFHHVTAGLLYKGNYLSRSLSERSDSDQLANISAEELDGK